MENETDGNNLKVTTVDWRPITFTPDHRRLRSRSIILDNPAFVGGFKDHLPLDTKPTTSYEVDSGPVYDPHEYPKADNPTSFWGTVMHVIILAAGPGVLSIPILFADAGYLVGALLMPCLFCLYVRNAYALMSCEYQLCKENRVPTLSYPEIAYRACQLGPTFMRPLAGSGRALSYLDFMFVWFSYYCYNYIIVCQNLRVLLQNVFDAQVPVNTLLVALLVPLLLLSAVPKLKFLVPVSLLGSVFNGLSLLVVVYFVLTDSTPWQPPPAVGRLYNVPLLVGAVLVNVNLSGLLIPLKNEMKNPKEFTSGRSVLALSYLPTAVAYTCFSLLCALKYGKDVKSSVIENLPQDNPVAQAGIALSTLAIICQQPLVIYVPYDLVWNEILRKNLNFRHPVIWENLLRMAMVCVGFLVSIAVPDVFLYLSLSGTVGTSIDSLILPALMHTMVMRKFRDKTTNFWLIFVKNMAIILLAAILVVFGCVDSVSQILTYHYR